MTPEVVQGEHRLVNHVAWARHDVVKYYISIAVPQTFLSRDFCH